MWLVVLVWFTEGLYDLQTEKHTVKPLKHWSHPLFKEKSDSRSRLFPPHHRTSPTIADLRSLLDASGAGVPIPGILRWESELDKSYAKGWESVSKI